MPPARPLAKKPRVLPAIPAPAASPLEPRTDYVVDAEIYRRVIRDEVPTAKRLLWIGTADVKDLYVPRGTRAVPFLAVLSELIGRGVGVRLIHAKEPGPNFRTDFDKYPNLRRGLERMLCPRVHFKLVVVDERFAYSGSANLTGAGLGAKGDSRRNFEGGIVTTEPALVRQIMGQFDAVWMGQGCRKCAYAKGCTDRVE